MQFVLQEVQWNSKGEQAELFVQTKVLEPKEVLTKVFGEVAPDKLVAAVVEGIRTIRASVNKSWSE